MSNLAPDTELDCPITEECGAIVQPRNRDLGGLFGKAGSAGNWPENDRTMDLF
ncbi:hypothetical protein [Marinobacter nauticus]|uniref:hypothetical protein n=1 Tax=Marinobacter nauticus TaxID=2743 RepID=UPI001F36D38F|nr:hypothetical protein [Marinobacter nauticus]